MITQLDFKLSNDNPPVGMGRTITVPEME